MWNIPTIFVAATVLLAACQTMPTVKTEPANLPQNCGAKQFQYLIGQPKKVLHTVKVPSEARIIGPDDAITADYRPDRLNFEIDKDGRIIKIGCY